MEHEEKKLCINCLYFVGVNNNDRKESLCDHPMFVSPVTGEVYMKCAILRFNSDNECGKGGDLFRAKQEIVNA